MSRTVGWIIVCGLISASWGADSARPVGEPVLERPTLHCLGAWWIIAGDENRDARILVDYRPAGAADWRAGHPLFRVEKGAHRDGRHGSLLNIPPDAWLFAGSIVMLEPDTEYQLRLRLEDPDGGAATRILTARTRSEPAASPDAPMRHVIPRGAQSAGGDGTAANPFRGLRFAQSNARPGDIFLLHAGIYPGTFNLTRSGEPGRPIIWRAAGDGPAIIDGQGDAERRPSRAISAGGLHDVWFEDLVVRNADWGIVMHESARMVIRRCHIHNVEYGITATLDRGRCEDLFIADNLIEGPSTWPRSKGIENARGIQLAGAGHVVCYNRIRGFADGIDTFPAQRVEAIDFHNNDISEMTDDGIEMDYSQRNTRCFHNRLTNIYHGISIQPVYGGPVYIFRNTMYNVAATPFKMHNSPSGALFYHNTAVSAGPPLQTLTPETVRNIIYRNNLFIGAGGDYAYEALPKMVDCDLDFDGFGGGPWPHFMKWNGRRYTFSQLRTRAPIYRNAVLVDAATTFASGTLWPDDIGRAWPPVDLQLSPSSAAVNAGIPLTGFNDHHRGPAPDLGAYELGHPPPHYGPRTGKR
jgi:hypothetical protein